MNNSVFQIELPASHDDTLRRVLYVSPPGEELFDSYVLEDVDTIPELVAPPSVHMYLQLLDYGVTDLLEDHRVVVFTTGDFAEKGFIGTHLVTSVVECPYTEQDADAYTVNTQDILNVR